MYFNWNLKVKQKFPLLFENNLETIVRQESTEVLLKLIEIV